MFRIEAQVTKDIHADAAALADGVLVLLVIRFEVDSPRPIPTPSCNHGWRCQRILIGCMASAELAAELLTFANIYRNKALAVFRRRSRCIVSHRHDSVLSEQLCNLFFVAAEMSLTLITLELLSKQPAIMRI